MTGTVHRVSRGSPTHADDVPHDDRVPGAPVYAAYLALQAVAGFAQWLLVAAWQPARAAFEVLASHPEVTDAFAVADTVAIVASGASAYAVMRGSRSQLPALAFTLAAVTYPTVFLVAWVARTGRTPAVALSVMIVVCTLTGWITYQVWRWTARPAGRVSRR